MPIGSRRETGRTPMIGRGPVDAPYIPSRIVEFLLARISESEAAATSALRRASRQASTGSPSDRALAADASEQAHASQRDCADRRAAIGQAQRELLFSGADGDGTGEAEALGSLYRMLVPHQTHPSFQPEWQGLVSDSLAST